MDNKYKNGKIYTIRYKNDDSLIYVGSTILPLYKRLSYHKSAAKITKNENRLLYKKMNETDINDWYIELYIGCPCESKEQLNKREGELIREFGTLNKNIAGKTREEFYKEYYEVNKVFLKEKAKEYYEVNKGFLKEKTKEFYEDNKEAIQKQRKDFYEINKDKINEKARNNYLKKKLEKEEAIITIS